MLQALATDVDRLIHNVIELSYFMRGAIPYESMMNRTPGERQRISEFIGNRIEMEAKKSFPNY